MISGIIGVTCLCFILLTGIKAQKFTTRAETNTPPIGEFIDIDGTKIHYVKQGSGPVLILFHGAGGNLKDYTYNLLPRLAQNHTVIAFDRPGHGYTDTFSNSAATLEAQSQLFFKAAEKLGIEDAYLIGYSYGGALSLNMALTYPEFVKGLVLVSSVAMPWPGEIDLNYRLMSKPVFGPALMSLGTAFLGDDYFRSSYKGIFTPHPEPDGFMDHVGVNMTVRVKSFVENSKQLNTLRPQIVEQSQNYSSLKMPIELIHGQDDTSVPISIHAEEFIKVVPHSNLVRIPDIKHALMQLRPDSVIEAIKRVTTSR